jgi:hypothetical protein
MDSGVSVEWIVFMLNITIAKLMVMELTQLHCFYAIGQTRTAVVAARQRPDGPLGRPIVPAGAETG